MMLWFTKGSHPSATMKAPPTLLGGFLHIKKPDMLAASDVDYPPESAGRLGGAFCCSEMLCYGQGMDGITLIFYAVVCGSLSVIAPKFPGFSVRLGVGAVVGILAASVLPYIQNMINGY